MADNGEGAVDDLLREIERALEAGLWYLALTGSLTIPDVCVALESGDGETNSDRYKAWFDLHVAWKYSSGSPGEGPVFTGADCWRYRCAILHLGTSQPSRNRYSRVVFVDPDNSNTFHRCVFNLGSDSVLNLDLRIFCTDLLVSAREWQVLSRKNPNYRANAEKIFRRHEDGLAPLIVGLAVYG